MNVKKSNATFRIINLRTKAVIGCNKWERNRTQDLLINISYKLNISNAIETDCVDDTADYRALKKKVQEKVSSSSFFLIESLTNYILDIVMEDQRITQATVTLDKPGALSSAESVSVEISGERNH